MELLTHLFTSVSNCLSSDSLGNRANNRKHSTKHTTTHNSTHTHTHNAEVHQQGEALRRLCLRWRQFKPRLCWLPRPQGQRPLCRQCAHQTAAEVDRRNEGQGRHDRHCQKVSHFIIIDFRFSIPISIPVMFSIVIYILFFVTIYDNVTMMDGCGKYNKKIFGI